MSSYNEINFFKHLSPVSKVVILTAVFALFSPLSIIIVAPLAEGWSWPSVVAWFLTSGIIATSWAYFYFEGKYLWVPPIVTVLMTVMFPLSSRFSGNAGVTELSGVSVISVALVVIGYIGFVVFISREGSRSVKVFTELNIARDIHEYLVPDIDFENESYEICCRSEACTEMGGDFTDITAVGDLLCVSIADVSGHGVPAGIMMAAIKGSMQTSCASIRDIEDANHILRDVNSSFRRIRTPEMFCTVASVVIGADGSGMVYNAGHLDVLHYHGDSRQVSCLESTSVPLGVVPDLECSGHEIQIKPGDVLAFVTDGLTESEDEDGVHLDLDSFAETIPSLSSLSTQAIAERFLEGAKNFGSNDDDKSVVIIKSKILSNT